MKIHEVSRRSPPTNANEKAVMEGCDLDFITKSQRDQRDGKEGLLHPQEGLLHPQEGLLHPPHLLLLGFRFTLSL